jgi:negative regulator of flagellin synthesis FlgM
MEKIQQIYLKQKKNVSESKSTSKHDSMTISDKALMIRELEKKITELPDIREEKVARIKEALSKGEYKVDSRAIAVKLLAGIEQE